MTVRAALCSCIYIISGKPAGTVFMEGLLALLTLSLIFENILRHFPALPREGPLKK